MPISNARERRFRVIIPGYSAFNIYSQVADKTTALGPICVASSAREVPGWDVEVIDENNLRLYGPKTETGRADHQRLQDARPADVIGLYGGLTSTIPRLYEIARFYKNAGVITIAGGQHFCQETIPEAFTHGVDYVVIGEGEQTIQELLRCIDDPQKISSIKGIAYLKDGEVIFTPAREPIADFDVFPLPDFSLVRHAKISLYSVGRIRGCGMDCEFCTVKGKPRPASSKRMLEYISTLVEKRDARHFFIVDDLFGQQRNETLAFCAMLTEYQQRIGRRLDFTAQIRLDKAKDTELLTAMRAAGINAVAIGFESPIAEELKVMKKAIRPEEMVALARIYQKFGFLVHGMFIFGYPLKDGAEFTMAASERVKHFRRFIRAAKIDTVQVLLPIPLPGTELRTRLQAQGRVYPLEDIGWEYYDGNFPIFEPAAPLTAENLQVCARKIMGKFYRFRYMFMVGWHTFSFPVLIFYLHNFKAGWVQWYRPWRNSVVRFGGWVIIKNWLSQFKKGSFAERLQNAQKHLKK